MTTNWVHTHTRPDLEREFAEHGRHGNGKGARARRQALKRMQAEDRNALTPPERRRVHRIAMQADEAAKATRQKTRSERIAQRNWIKKAQEARS